MKTVLVPGFLLIVGSAILGGCHKQKQATSPEVEVAAFEVAARTSADAAVLSGTIEAVDKSDVAFMVPGRVLAVEVADGALVKEGDVLARLDPADFEQALTISEANLTEIKNRHARLSRLHELGSLTETDFDKIVSGLQQAESSTELARRQLGYTELRAPFSGIVTKHSIAAGVVVGPGIPVFTVLAPAPVWANVGVAESDARRIQVGMTAEVVVPATGVVVSGGVVDSILPQADSLSRSFTAKIRLANSDRLLRPGNVVVVRVRTGESRSAVLVPPQVVLRNPDGSLYVWVVDKVRHTALRQIVEAGALRETEVEILSGLKVGDQVVLNVPLTLFEGTSLKVTLSK